ncbi:MAG: cytochrome c [Bdellovibrionales bacterium]|nr:cytochrome c [Bdellovibrionales bacterium]
MLTRALFRNFSLLALCGTLTGCFTDTPYPSEALQTYFRDNLFNSEHSGQARFLMDDFGSLNPNSLTVGNIIPLKIYTTALLLADPTLKAHLIKGSDVPKVMEQYGFISPTSIANWRTDLAPRPHVPGIVGFIHTTIDFDVPVYARAQLPLKHFRMEVGNITCAACHSSVTYDAGGIPQKSVWLGGGNSSLNIDGFFDQIYRGLKIGMADQKAFYKRIQQVYPNIDPLEEKTIKTLFKTIAKELKKYEPMNRVFSYPNGGPGLTNGVGAFKRDAGLVDKYRFNPHEAGIVSIPDISNRGFRSSFTYDGAYGVPRKPRWEPVDARTARDPKHLDQMAELAAFFTYSAMGNNIKNIEPNIPRVHQVFQEFIKDLQPPKFPGAINTTLATRGEALYAQKCADCHGTYIPGIDHPKLVSFPNKFVTSDEIKTDPQRWQNIDKPVRDFTQKTIFAKYIDAGMKLGGYVAPILSGVWYTAPYLHNGSVPTLWQLMNPSERAKKFQLGGHALDYVHVGILGVTRSDGVYAYPSGYTPWMRSGVYDTSMPGQSNTGHEAQFAGLTTEDKWALLEYLKLL